ncbi:MAG TPA: 4-hydroxythreonine-4-phosphate dehydrogenase PdxA [Fimbriiglobus sp.]|nr:4-hydroxythreonine-4-phosphate dehydrogenase PdxA [Fimbriiglobus sp.]
MRKPTLLITLGDVAGIGPEIVARAWPNLRDYCTPVVVGDPGWVGQGCELVGVQAEPLEYALIEDVPPDLPAGLIPVLNPLSGHDLSAIRSGTVSAEGGAAAYSYLTFAIDECLAGRADGIVTCPLHKEGLHAAGVHYPGHTEILADRTGAKSHAMLLYDEELPLAVAHVTLHMALRDVFRHITKESVLDKVRLLHDIVPRLTGRPARIAVAALNPHASDGGLFGDEEQTVIAPAVEAARAEGIDAAGPIAADAVFLPHNRAKYDGVVAMVHDHGHIAMKLLGGRRAVNVTAGLPIVRTSVAHGTAYDIAGKGVADESSLVSAVRVAARLAARNNRASESSFS